MMDVMTHLRLLLMLFYKYIIYKYLTVGAIRFSKLPTHGRVGMVNILETLKMQETTLIPVCTDFMARSR